MGKIWALTRARWLTAASYRVRIAFSFAALIGSIVPVYFIADALQPVMAESIRGEGGQYFGFLVVGMISLTFVGNAVNALPGQISGGITTGTLEVLLSTPTRLPTLLAGLWGFGLLWTLLRAFVLLLTGWVLGAQIAWTQLAAAGVIIALIILAYLPMGVLGAAAVLAVRTTGPFPGAVVAISGLLGGVYYPTRVIPSWIQDVSHAVPLTYGLRALRPVLMEGRSLLWVRTDLMILGAFIVVLSLLSAVAFSASYRYARRVGSLTQY